MKIKQSMESKGIQLALYVIFDTTTKAHLAPSDLLPFQGPLIYDIEELEVRPSLGPANGNGFPSDWGHTIVLPLLTCFRIGYNRIEDSENLL